MARADHGMGTSTPGTPQGIPDASGDEDVVTRSEERVVSGPDGLERAPSGTPPGYQNPQARTSAPPVAVAHGAGDESTARTANQSREKEDGVAQGDAITPADVLGNIQAQNQAEEDTKKARRIEARD